MDGSHSNLELVRFDDTATAPERDHDATAGLAPQATPDATPEVLHSTLLPEFHGNIEVSSKEFASSHYVIKPTLRKPLLKWVWVMMTLIIAAAIAIGAGVGTRRHRQHSLHESSYILNDTSLAALSLENGDRQLFFQDNTGLIRRAIRTASSSEWITSKSLNVSSNPKNHTPLAVTSSGLDSRDEEKQIKLYYVSESHVLNASVYYQDSWCQNLEIFESYTAAMDTRSLSIALIEAAPSDLPKGNSTYNSALLYYENTQGKISALLRRVQNQSFAQSETGEAQWIDITSQESKALPNEFYNVPGSNYSRTLYESNTNATFSTPFTVKGNSSGSYAGALFYSLPNASLEIDHRPTPDGAFVFASYTSSFNGPGNFTDWISDTSNDQEADGPVEYPASLHQSDVALFGQNYAIWINGTQPVIIEINFPPDSPEAPTPYNAFPFTRLATSNSADQSLTLLYHQINDTTFAEEQWDNSANAWIFSEYIVVSDS